MINCLVIKKDGTKEEFNLEKIFEVVKAAGASDDVAEKVVNKVVERLFEVKSSKLRRLVYRNLSKIDKKAAKNYKKYYFKEHY